MDSLVEKTRMQNDTDFCCPQNATRKGSDVPLLGIVADGILTIFREQFESPLEKKRCGKPIFLLTICDILRFVSAAVTLDSNDTVSSLIDHSIQTSTYL